MKTENTINLYTIYDRLADSCYPVFESQSDGMAARQAAKIFEQNKLHPDEFGLIRIAILNRETCIVTPALQELKTLLLNVLESKSFNDKWEDVHNEQG